MGYLKLLGSVGIEDESGSPVSGVTGRRHPVALLSLLAATRDRAMPRGKLVGLLWPTAPEKKARNRLNTCVHTVRSGLGDEVLISAGDELRLNSDALECDLWQFEDALENDYYETAVDRYGGPFLDGFYLDDSPPFEKWVDRQRDRLRRGYRDALEALAEMAEERGDPGAAANWWRERANEDPYDSRVVRRLMEALAEAGNPAAALQAAEVHHRVMREELGASPDEAVAELAEELRSGGKPVAAGSGPEEEPLGTPEATAPAPEDATIEADGAPPGEGPFPTVVETSGTRTGGGRRSMMALAAVVLALAAGGLAAWMLGGGEENTGTEPTDRTIAVLPFEVLGQERDDDFGEGIHAGLLTRLAGVSELRVISATSVRRYRDAEKPLPEIARELGASWVFEGEVQRVGDGVQVNAQLVDAETDTHLWAESYQRDSLTARNAFEIQAALAREIVSALEVQLTPEDERQVASVPTENTAAYELYLQAEGMEGAPDEVSLKRRTELYNRAVALDTTFAPAWAGLADVYVDRAWVDGGSAAVADSGRRFSRRALELDPELADAHVQLGDALSMLGEENAAMDRYRRALELHPDHREAAGNLRTLLDRRGAMAEKARLLDRLITISPRSPEVLRYLIALNVEVGREEVAEKWRGYGRDLGISLAPETEFDLALFVRGDVERARQYRDELPAPEDGTRRARRRAALALYQGDWSEARERYRVLYTGRPGVSRPIFNGLLEDRLGLAWALDRLGQHGEAREIAAEVAREAEGRIRKGTSSWTPHHGLAVARLLRGDTARAIDALEAGLQAGFRSKGTLETVPTLEPLRDHPRFRRLLVRLDSLLAEDRRRIEANGWAEPPGVAGPNGGRSPG